MNFDRARIVMEGFFGERPSLSRCGYTYYISTMLDSTWKNTRLNKDFDALYTWEDSEDKWPDSYDQWLQSLEKWIKVTYAGQIRDVMWNSIRDVLNGRETKLIRYDISLTE